MRQRRVCGWASQRELSHTRQNHDFGMFGPPSCFGAAGWRGGRCRMGWRRAGRRGRVLGGGAEPGGTPGASPGATQRCTTRATSRSASRFLMSAYVSFLAFGQLAWLLFSRRQTRVLPAPGAAWRRVPSAGAAAGAALAVQQLRAPVQHSNRSTQPPVWQANSTSSLRHSLTSVLCTRYSGALWRPLRGQRAAAGPGARQLHRRRAAAGHRRQRPPTMLGKLEAGSDSLRT